MLRAPLLIGCCLTAAACFLAGCATPSQPMQPTVTRTVTETPVPDAAQPAPRMAPNCDPNYAGGCVPAVAYDLDCADIGFMVEVVGSDPHGFDRDLNGLGCESYG